MSPLPSSAVYLHRVSSPLSCLPPPPLLTYSPATARSYASPASASSTSSSYPPPPLPSSTSSTTPQVAQAYLSNLFSLPPSRQFNPALALQILTHKSYRFAHPVRHSQSLSEAQSPIAQESSAPHNARLAFLGRRALSTYLALFVHEAYGSSGALREQGSDFLRGKELEERLTALRHVNNLGRMVGGEWRVEDVLRWDRNQVCESSAVSLVAGEEEGKRKQLTTCRLLRPAETFPSRAKRSKLSSVVSLLNSALQQRIVHSISTFCPNSSAS